MRRRLQCGVENKPSAANSVRCVRCKFVPMNDAYINSVKATCSAAFKGILENDVLASR